MIYRLFLKAVDRLYQHGERKRANTPNPAGQP